MRLQRTTRVNSVMFQDKNQKDILVFSSNVNLTFGEYLEKCKTPLFTLSGNRGVVPNSINNMLDFDYTFKKSVRAGQHIQNLYHYKDDRFTISFVELT